jgi:hypothetical protein
MNLINLKCVDPDIISFFNLIHLKVTHKMILLIAVMISCLLQKVKNNSISDRKTVNCENTVHSVRNLDITSMRNVDVD